MVPDNETSVGVIFWIEFKSMDFVSANKQIN